MGLRPTTSIRSKPGGFFSTTGSARFRPHSTCRELVKTGRHLRDQHWLCRGRSRIRSAALETAHGPADHFGFGLGLVGATAPGFRDAIAILRLRLMLHLAQQSHAIFEGS